MDVSAIEVRDLTRDYGSLRAVDHVSFTVAPGEVFGFLGPNGAGKTTTVRMLTTLLEPTYGTALLNGYDVVRQGYQARRQFGVVPEESNVYRELTARANLLFSGKLYRVPKAERERRAVELMTRFGMADRLDALVDTFSRGMRRKLTIAMALMHRPSILFLDEPTAGLDVQGQRSIIESIRQLSAEGMTIFLTTHQIEEANQLCDRVAIINQGK
ncbi:MAG: ABC transporter ATP-binding protein, partial [Anaerolineae bacterium]|nr:ABC transporter ATP-binding protein [Anaerolineae bacterium]